MVPPNGASKAELLLGYIAGLCRLEMVSGWAVFRVDS